MSQLSEGSQVSSTRSTMDGRTKTRWCDDFAIRLKNEFQKLHKMEPTKGNTLHPLINDVEWRTRLFYKKFEPIGVTRARWNRNYVKTVRSFQLELEIFGSDAYAQVENDSKTSMRNDAPKHKRLPLSSLSLNSNQQACDPHYGILAKRKQGKRWCYTEKLKEEFQKVQTNYPNKEEEINPMILNKEWKEKLFYNEFESLGVTKIQWNRNYISALRSFEQNIYQNEPVYQRSNGKVLETDDEDSECKVRTAVYKGKNIVHNLIHFASLDHHNSHIIISMGLERM